jgi:hypothetical protein
MDKFVFGKKPKTVPKFFLVTQRETDKQFVQHQQVLLYIQSERVYLIFDCRNPWKIEHIEIPIEQQQTVGLGMR